MPSTTTNNNNDNTTPLLSDVDVEEEEQQQPQSSGAATAEDEVTTPELVSEASNNEDSPTTPHQEEDANDILAGLVIRGPPRKRYYAWFYPLHYPYFQRGYSPAMRGNPLPASIAIYTQEQYCDLQPTQLETMWADLMQELDLHVNTYVKKIFWLYLAWSLCLVTLFPILTTYIGIRQEWGWMPDICFMALVSLIVWVFLVKIIATQPFLEGTRQLVASKQQDWKRHAHIQLKLKHHQFGMNFLSNWPCCCCLAMMFRQEETWLLFKKHVPVEQRQAQIAFV